VTESVEVVVIVPARDEEGGVGRVVSDVASALANDGRFASFEVVVVDDGSRDLTAEVARQAGARVLTNPTSRGYGGALKRGIRATNAGTICVIDADGTYPADAVPELLSLVQEGADQAIGSRVAAGAQVPWERRPAKWMVTRIASLLTRHRIQDLNSGLRCFRRERVEGLLRLMPDGFSFTSTLTVAALLDGWELVWRPIGYRPRLGRSKFKAVRDTLRLLLALVRAVVYFDPLRFFMPVAIGLGVCGFAFAVWDVVWEANLTDKTVLLSLSALEVFVLGLLADLLVKRTGRTS
jgi:glycosyltransferase involved in cell wall biosynthesis